MSGRPSSGPVQAVRESPKSGGVHCGVAGEKFAIVRPAASNSVDHGGAPTGAAASSNWTGIDRSWIKRPAASSDTKCESVSRIGGSFDVAVNGTARDIMKRGLV